MQPENNQPLPSSLFPNRAQLEAAIKKFDIDDPKYDATCRIHRGCTLPHSQKLKKYFILKHRNDAIWHTNNPYSFQCGNFSKAYHQHLKDMNIPSIQVSCGSGAHQYLLVPVQEKAGIKCLILDPTAEQL